MNAPQEYAGLSKADVKAIRVADRAYVHVQAERVTIRLERDSYEDKAGYRSIPGTYEIEIPANAGGRYGSHKFTGGMLVYRDGAFQALANIVREGDFLYFSLRYNGCGYLDAAEIPAGKMGGYHNGGYARLYQEELTVTIVRGKKWIIREWVLDSRTSVDNTAKSIKEPQPDDSRMYRPKNPKTQPDFHPLDVHEAEEVSTNDT